MEERLASLLAAISLLFFLRLDVRNIHALNGRRHVLFDCAMTTSVQGAVRISWRLQQ